MKKILCIGLTICFMAMFLVVPSVLNIPPRILAAASLSKSIGILDSEREVIGRDTERIDTDMRIYNTATIDDNFCASSVLVVKKAEYSQITTE